MPAADRPSLRAPLLVVCAVMIALTALAVLADYRADRAREVARLEGIAELRANTLEGWISQRLSESQFLRNSDVVAQLLQSWLDRRDPASAERLFTRLREYAQANRYEGWLLLDGTGQPIGGAEGQDHTIGPELRAAAERAVRIGQTQLTPIYAGDGQPPRIDFVTPLNRSGSPPRAVVALRVDASAFVLPALRTWPVPSRSAESVLVRLQDGQLIGHLGRSAPLPLSRRPTCWQPGRSAATCPWGWPSTAPTSVAPR